MKRECLVLPFFHYTLQLQRIKHLSLQPIKIKVLGWMRGWKTLKNELSLISPSLLKLLMVFCSSEFQAVTGDVERCWHVSDSSMKYKCIKLQNLPLAILRGRQRQFVYHEGLAVSWLGAGTSVCAQPAPLKSGKGGTGRHPPTLSRGAFTNCPEFPI